jgi:hypothetical protein
MVIVKRTRIRESILWRGNWDRGIWDQHWRSVNMEEEMYIGNGMIII